MPGRPSGLRVPGVEGEERHTTRIQGEMPDHKSQDDGMITSSRESRSLMSILSSPALPHPRKPDNCLFLQRPEDELASLAGTLSLFVSFLGKKCQGRSLRQIRWEDCSRLLHDNCVCELKEPTCSCDKQGSFHSSGSLKFGDANGLPRPGPESQPLSLLVFLQAEGSIRSSLDHTAWHDRKALMLQTAEPHPVLQHLFQTPGHLSVSEFV